MIDITTSAIVLALMAAFCLPFILSHQKKKRHEKALIETFMQQANSSNLKISVYDLWRRVYVIGIDQDKNQLLYMKFLPEPHSVLVDLKNIRRVSISKQEREIGSGKEMTRVIEKLYLVLESRDSPTSSLEFYDSDINMGLSGESVLIQKWHDMINGALLQRPEQQALVRKKVKDH